MTDTGWLGDGWRGLRAISAVSVLEIWRQKLWLVGLIAALVLGLIIPQLEAIDSGDRLRLAITVLVAGQSFVGLLMAMLVAAGQLRRDIDQRQALLLFAKPLSLSAYLAGRWLGVMLAIFGLLVVMAASAWASLWLAHGAPPRMYETRQAVHWEQVDGYGQSQQIDGDRLQLNGAAGNALRWHFPPLPGAGAAQVLIKADVRSATPGWDVRRCRVRVRAWPAGQGDRAIALAVSAESPFGTSEELALAPGEALLYRRGAERQDIGRDYLHLQLPGELADQAVVIELGRLDAQAILRVHRSGALLGRDGGRFLVHLLAATLGLSAQIGIVAAAALFLAAISNLGVALLGAGTLVMGAHSHEVIAQVLAQGAYPRPLARLLELLQLVLPDFERSGYAVALAAGRSIDGGDLLVRCLMEGAYAGLLLLLAAWALARREA